MRSHPTRSATRYKRAGAQAHAPLPVTAPLDRFEGGRRSNVAVLLNGQARRVTPKLVQQFEAIVGRDHVFFSQSLAQARGFIATIADGGYDTVVCCGGDGTLITAINMMQTCIAQHATPPPTPRFAQLTLGTGNALRQLVRASEPVADLKQIHGGHAVDRPVSLVRDQAGTAFFFAGVGHDALLMHDYDRLQHSLPAGLSRHVLRSKMGFGTALLSRTVPQAVLRRNHARAVVHATGPCYRLDQQDGKTWVATPPGELFTGPIGTLGVSTVPCLGYDIRMFPFADKYPGLMHLRITQMSLLGMMAHSKSLWRGTYQHPTRCHDFLVADVDVRLSRKLHYQHSGEPQGRVDRIHFTVVPNGITLAAQPAP